MSLGVSAVKSIVLSMIGGSTLMPIPTTTIAGSTAVSQMSLGTLASLASAALEVASSVGTMSSLVENPVGGIASDLGSTVGDLTGNNFSNLDSTLSTVASNGALTDSYNNLKNALGGGDGTAGLNSTLTKFKDHTDKISGVAVSTDSDLNKPLTIPQTPGGR
jgi:hypothetical protein